MNKIIGYAPVLVTRAMAGDPISIALLAALGISLGYKALIGTTMNKKEES